MIVDKLRQEINTALKQQDGVTVRTLRQLLSALEYKKIQKMGEMTAEDEIAVVKSEIKKRQEASEIYRQHGEEQRAMSEELELGVLEKYMPAQVDEAVVRQTILDLKKQLGENANKGQLIGQVIAKLGRENVDGSLVAKLVQESL